VFETGSMKARSGPCGNEYWAFPGTGDVPVPGGTAANPIDAFIDQRLASTGIEAQPAADPRTLLRRLYFDLIGLPPSPAEAEAFFSKVSCDAKAAVDSLVDALLADPRYGERWARQLARPRALWRERWIRR
jgi:hypothetical protein